MQLGANKRFNRLVVGAEVDFGAFDLGGRQGAAEVQYPSFPPFIRYTVDTAYSTDWLFTARGRLGWLPSENLLVYVTGGLAASEVKISNSFWDHVSGVRGAEGGDTRTQRKVGYAVGGGFEFAVSGPWSVKGEYLFVDLGEADVYSFLELKRANQHNPLDTSADLTAHVVRIGINYSFSD